MSNGYAGTGTVTHGDVQIEVRCRLDRHGAAGWSGSITPSSKDETLWDALGETVRLRVGTLEADGLLGKIDALSGAARITGTGAAPF